MIRPTATTLFSPDKRPPSPEVTLRKLFLTLFLRGRSARGLQKEKTPKSIGGKLAGTLTIYTLVGLLAFTFRRQPIFPLSIYLHAMTFVFLGMFIASSAGEILFNREEADILLHRPVPPRSMLWAKVRVLVEVSLWISLAFNLVGFAVGSFASDGGWRFPLAHLASVSLEAMFCTSGVVLMYQVCLRWFGRERVEGLMTAAQILVSVGAVLGGQILPRLVIRFDRVLTPGEIDGWVYLLPPAWFAGIDDAFAGSGSSSSWLLAASALGATSLVALLAFGKLARAYEIGLQSFNETVSSRVHKRGKRRWIDTLVDLPPLCWSLRDPVTRASFLLCAAYLVRDRETKLRIYPGIAPMMVLPVMFLFQGIGGRAGRPEIFASDFFVCFAASYIGMVPLLGLTMLQFSQQWQAADVFRAAPIAGPTPLCNGARRAVLFLLTLPALIVCTLMILCIHRDISQLPLLLPGIIAVPIYALTPNLGGRGVPFATPIDEAKSTGRGLTMMVVSFASFGISGLASWAWITGWFWWFVLIEAILALILHRLMYYSLNSAQWTPAE